LVAVRFMERRLESCTRRETLGERACAPRTATATAAALPLPSFSSVSSVGSMASKTVAVENDNDSTRGC
jgi:hypothetical protein